MARELSQRFTMLRRHHAAWMLLASRNGPLILAGLKSLIDSQPGGIAFEEAVEHIANSFAHFTNDAEYDLGDDYSITARKELRQWIKRGLIVERGGMILATDALQRALQFLESLEEHSMTSTASRLATVQRAIESLETQLSRSQTSREKLLSARIEALTRELDAVKAGNFEVLSGQQAEEGIREVYQLAISLQADFRRVEDSYREADRTLRQRIISEKRNRGEIIDELLSGHDSLLKTVEGQVFEAFHQQLVKAAELEQMKSQLRSILGNKSTERALHRKQRSDLHQLVSRLVQESERVILARARSERDVRGFIKSGLASEQLRVGALLQDIFQAALEIDWQSQAVRRAPSSLPTIAISISNLPIIERLQVKQVEDDSHRDLDLSLNEANPADMDGEFWQAFHVLDRAKLFELTVEALRAVGQPLSLRELAEALPPAHDLETLAYWLAMARQVGVPIDDCYEVVDLQDNIDGSITRFHVPIVKVTHAVVATLDSGSLE